MCTLKTTHAHTQGTISLKKKNHRQRGLQNVGAYIEKDWQASRCLQTHAMIARGELVTHVSTVRRREPRVLGVQNLDLHHMKCGAQGEKGWGGEGVSDEGGEWGEWSRWVSHLVDEAKVREMKRRGSVHWRESWKDVWVWVSWEVRGCLCEIYKYECVNGVGVCVGMFMCSRTVQLRLRCRRTIQLSYLGRLLKTFCYHTHSVAFNNYHELKKTLTTFNFIQDAELCHYLTKNLWLGLFYCSTLV